MSYTLPLLLLLVLFRADATAQSSVYRTRVRTADGQRITGTLNEVTATYLSIDGYSIPLRDVRKTVITRSDRGGGTWAGAVVGGIGVGYLTNRSLQNERVSNGFLYGASLVLGAAAGAAAGAVLGHAVNKLSRADRVVFRPQSGEEAVLSLSRQLRPYSRDYQEDLLNNDLNSLDR